MRLLAFSDLHRDRNAAGRLVEMSRDADVVIGAGDFASFRLGLGSTVDVLRAIERPVVLVPGNNETDSALWRACGGWESARVLHGEGVALEGVDFFGLGGGCPPTPFPWSFDVSEEKAESMLAQCPPGGVLVTHSPPFGHVDEAFSRHLGSKAVLRAVERCRPKLVVCGHIHQRWGEESFIGSTPVVNVGPHGRWFDV